jgi:hypothetical protein
MWMENKSGEGTHVREDVTGRGGVFAAMESGPELAAGDEQVDVVGADEVLCHVDDGHHQRRFAVVIGRLLGNRT